MWRYALRRTAAAIPTLWVVITVCYLLLHLTPGGPFDGERALYPAVLENLKAKYHLDLPVWQQYLLYLRGLLSGDLGVSFRFSDWNVNELVRAAAPVSILIGGVSLVMSLTVGVAMGIAAALRRNSAVDYCVMGLANIGHTIPSFVLGPVLVLVFALMLGWLPAGGWQASDWRYAVLPIALLTIINMGTIGRVTRGSLIEVMSSPFIRTARAKGLPMTTIVLRHAIKPTLLPVVSLLGPLAISSMTSAVVTETVFSIPGLGRLVVSAAVNRDYTLVLGLVVLVTAVAVLLNFLVDLCYAWLDPKIRY